MVHHAIKTQPRSEIPCAKLRRFSPKETEEITKQVKQLIAKKFIQPSNSPFGANVLLVKKQDGTWRFCIDYRALNAITVKDRFPLPNLHGQLQYLQQAKYFSTLDLTQEYYQIAIQSQDKPKTAFRTSDGV